jgi:hypothetical protein
MPRLRLPRLTAAAVLCGTALFGWSLGGIASVDRQLQAGPPTTTTPTPTPSVTTVRTSLVPDRSGEHHGHHDHHGL